jgi:hypothetical protein
MKAADAVRNESRESQKIQQTLVKDQVETLLKVNDGFRQDIVRLNAKQDGLRDSVKGVIKVGLQEIKEQMYTVSIKEILNEIPRTFRTDLEAELSLAIERTIQNVVEKLKSSSVDSISDEAMFAFASRASDVVARRLEDKLRRRFDDPRLSDPWLTERYVDRVADQIWMRLEYRSSHICRYREGGK